MTRSFVKPLVIITALIVIVVSVLAIALTPKHNESKRLAIDTTGQPTLGKTNAPVHIVVFEDLKCPNCRDFNLTILPMIKKKYIAAGIAKYTVITLAFIPGSIPAGNSALCLREQREDYFFPFVNYLFQHQPSEEEDWATIPRLLNFAKKAVPQANLSALSNCIFNSNHTAKLQQNLKLAAKLMKNQVETPTVYVNGIVVKPLTLQRMETMIKHASMAR